MQTVFKTLELFDDLLSAGYDNSNIVVISQDSENVSMKEYFGVFGKGSKEPLKRGVYVYQNTNNTEDLEMMFEDANEVYQVADDNFLYFFNI